MGNRKLHRTDTFELRDNQFVNGHLQLRVDSVALTNNLFRRAGAGFGSYEISGDPPINTALVLQNNTFFGCDLVFANNLGNSWYAQDNVLDGVASVYLLGTYAVSNRNNGYAGGSARFLPTNATDVVVSSITWQTGPLGNFYQLTNSAFLDKGSTRATNVGLYHFTATTNLVREGVSLVDLGFHYVATSSTGVPIDTDGDGWAAWADWQEDTNGNGVQDGVETSFNSTFFGSTNQAQQVNLRTFTPLR